jgi:(p)ppGpp synthase/HD superfamily hydrolase
LTASERTVAQVDGWILGVSANRKPKRAGQPPSRQRQFRTNRRKPIPRFTAAFEYARDAHGDQKRKSTDIPYLSHPMSVSALVMEYGGDEDQAIAGLQGCCTM